MTIGDFSVKTGLSAKTLRYYEDIGLLTPERTAAGWRRYGDNEALIVRLLGVGKHLGLELSQIVRFVGLFRDPGVGNDELRRELAPHRHRLGAEIAALIEAQGLLESLITDCPLRRC